MGCDLKGRMMVRGQTGKKHLISAVSTVRAAQNDLDMFINYHLNCGVDRMFLFFDDPTDKSFEHLRMTGSPAYGVTRRIGLLRGSRNNSLEGRQIHNASLALEWARREGFDWIVHIDSDELVYTPEQDLGHYLQNVDENIDAITFPTLEALPKLKYARHFFEEVHWFKTAKSFPHAEAIARVIGCRRVFKYGYFRGHTTGKTATRVRSSVASIGIHLPTARDERKSRIRRSSDAFTLHFDCCTFDTWKLKWKSRCDGTSVALRMTDDRKRQLEDFLAAYQSGSEAHSLLAYRRQCIVSTYERVILQGLGLLRRVQLKNGAFLDLRHEPLCQLGDIAAFRCGPFC